MNDLLNKNKYPKGTALLIIDAQDKIISPILNKEKIIKNISKFLNAYKVLGGANIYISEQNPTKLGPTTSSLVKDNQLTRLVKMDFSIINDKLFINELESQKISTLIVCGFETHICVQQSVLDLIKINTEVYILADAMGSRNSVDHHIGIKRMMSKGAIIASVESMIFELCQTSSRKEFKYIRDLIKNN